MARMTYFVALPFLWGEDGDIATGEAQEARDAGQASRMAARLAEAPGNCGAVAFSRTGDPAIGEFDDGVVIRAFGEVELGQFAG